MKKTNRFQMFMKHKKKPQKLGRKVQRPNSSKIYRYVIVQTFPMEVSTGFPTDKTHTCNIIGTKGSRSYNFYPETNIFTPSVTPCPTGAWLSTNLASVCSFFVKSVKYFQQFSHISFFRIFIWLLLSRRCKCQLVLTTGAENCDKH